LRRIEPDCLLPGFHRIPQAEPGLTLDLLSAPIDAALGQLSARVDLFRLHGLENAGAGFAHALARVAAPQARLLGEGLTPEQVAALEAQGFVFEACAEPDKQKARFRQPQAAPAGRRRRRSGAPSCSAPASPAPPPASACARAAGK
jgi:tRNA 5-methylaminomethyl-2-thiouridine biosynthesis bifunctional protein